jgi:hypothetical protein
MSAEQPTLLAVGAGSVWTANHTGYSVSQVDPHNNKIVHTIPLGSYDAVPCGIAATHGRRDTRHRLRHLRRNHLQLRELR